MEKTKEIIEKNKINSLFIISAITIIVVGFIIIFPYLNINNKGNTEKICILEYNVNGGTQINSLAIECGAKISEPNHPNKEGFEFLGWYIDDEKVNFDKLYLNESLTIEARWKAKENIEIVIVRFDTKGGNDINGIEVAKDTKLTPPLEPKKEGYVFKYWSYNDKRFDFMNDISENIMLVAVWEKEIEKNPNSDSSNNSNNNSNNNNDDSSNMPSTLEKCTYEIKDLNSEYNGKIPNFDVGLGEKRQIYSYFGFWSYNYNSCDIIYKTENSSIATVSSDGTITGKKLGSTYLDICVVDKSTNKELDCFKWNLIIKYEPGTEQTKNDTNNLVNAINGHYWYLDGYEYAYIKVDNIDWFEHKLLDWTSKYIELENNKFVTTEDTGIIYLNSSNIHNEFLVNPTEFAYSLIEDYNMHVSSNKLYITLGSKTYSFTKGSSEKIVKAKLSVDKTSLIVGKGELVSVDVIISPSYATYNLSVLSSNPSVLSNCSVHGKSIKCYANSIGTSTLTIKDSNGATAKTEVTVQKVNVSGISLNKSTINLERGNSETIAATVSPSNAEVKTVTWTSSNPSVAQVSSNGKVTAISEGSVTITATTNDGGFTANCIVNVTNPPLSAKGSIGYTILTTSSGIYGGVSVDVSATGGTGNYTYYYIKLYTSDGTLIGETSSTTSNEIFVSGYKNGSYYAEFEVRDSNGQTYTGKTGITTISM